MSITVTTRGRITLPAWVRERLGVGPGDKVEFVLADNERAVLTNVSGSPPKKGSSGQSERG
jgi:AbrB family looped-hinge helix DNA binding protein